MAAGDLAGSFQDEVTCSICLEYFTDPVSIECGHNFCQTCISQCCGEPEPNFSCPQCRETSQQRNLWPNKQLGNLVELVKCLRLQSVTEPEGERVCERHQEALKLFCEEDQTPICVVCDKSKAHHAHTVVPIEEAAQEYREQILSRLQCLREEREELLGLKSYWDRESERLQRQTEVERQLVVFECEQLRQFLAQQEHLLLARLGELDKEIGRRREENVTRLCKEISQLSVLIMELEGKCQQPAPELLQDIKGTMSRAEQEKFQNPAAFSSELNWRIGESSQRNASLETIMRKFKDLLSSRLRLDKANLTLDPDTVHPQLIVSVDRKSVRRGTQQALPNKPQRFDTEPSVLGCEGFTSGRHYWEVEVGRGVCDVGVARESVRRKGRISLYSEQGIWAVECWEGQYQAHTSPAQSIPLSPSWGRCRIWVYLDYERGQVAFFNAGTGDPIFTFPSASFAGERIRPFFWVVGSALLTLCPLGALSVPMKQSPLAPTP
ncbi:zinc finger protein RFP-like [Mauremys reevesii]|uniref:zinc finger protein RFP-like n=1 Tax=Mauremys reevesii TaxID=260615 RepID=UPI00193EEEDF|nr:zinc finger protein RFP-like [Mauremys reevesii]